MKDHKISKKQWPSNEARVGINIEGKRIWAKRRSNKTSAQARRPQTDLAKKPSLESIQFRSARPSGFFKECQKTKKQNLSKMLHVDQCNVPLMCCLFHRARKDHLTNQPMSKSHEIKIACDRTFTRSSLGYGNIKKHLIHFILCVAGIQKSI